MPAYRELNLDPLYVSPQMHGADFQYLRVPRLNVGCFAAPHLPTVLTVPSNPPSVRATQLDTQFSAHDQLLGAP